MKILPVLLIFTTLPAFAQTSTAPATSPAPAIRESPRVPRATPPPRAAKPTVKPSAETSTKPSATPLPIRRAVRVTPDGKKPGFFQNLGRIFSGKPKYVTPPAPAASPTATPAAVANTRKKAPSVSTTPTTETTPGSGAVVSTSSTSSIHPSLPEATPQSRSVLVPTKSKPSASVKVTPPVQEDAPAPVVIPRGVEEAAPGDETPYQRVRREAARDPQVAALSDKLNAADPGDAYKTAAREYVAALFAKMREIDPSQVDWFNRMEGATIRRIDSGKPFVAE